MLSHPPKGFARSVEAHNVELDAMAEWLEACVTFVDESLSRSEVLDALIEGNLYGKQDLANIRIGDAWAELKRRKRCLGEHCTYTVQGARIVRTQDWRDVPAYAFCLLAALHVAYRAEFVKMFGHDYADQGALLERLTAEAMAAAGWSTHSTAWSKKAASSIFKKVEALAEHLGERSRPEAVEVWGSTSAKDGGLDVVCHFPFHDGWSGRPLLYIQCASGDDWRTKRATPNLAIWKKLLDLATDPTRGIAIPFALLADDFRKAANSDLLSLVLDRHRLSAPSPTLNAGWVSARLADDLNKWTAQRLPALLTARTN